MDMSYLTLARKYRPQTFDDVVGQEVVIKTLRNSFIRGRVANAYLFCGSKGVGKTSIARLFSKALNCSESSEKSPCNKCVSCIEITKGSSLDVLEIDGASNNRVDEMRVLLENVQFGPSKGKFKIYIIDEVHMLTPGAFNALLKTLEEPPSHVKFIFATTEQHKVLPTIVSRCQTFEFKRISPIAISDRLKEIAELENISIDEKARLLIARSSDGSLRDALVVMDQMVSFSEGKITADDVADLLGVVRKDNIFDLAGAVINGDATLAIKLLDDMIDKGKDPFFIANSLISHYRDLMILKTTGVPTSDMAFHEDELARMKEQLSGLTIDEILYILQNCIHCLTIMKNTILARAPFEIALTRLSMRGSILSIDEIMKRLEKFDNLSAECITVNPLPTKPIKRDELNQGETQKKKDVQVEERKKVDRLETIAIHEEDTSLENNGDVPSQFNWDFVLNYIKSKKMLVFTFLSAGRLVEFTAERIKIVFKKKQSFHKETLDTEANKAIINDAIKNVTGVSPKLEFIVEEEIENSEDIFSSKDFEKSEKEKIKIEMKPVIEKAMDIFGAHVVRDFTEDRVS